jgi:hypothetical protein
LVRINLGVYGSYTIDKVVGVFVRFVRPLPCNNQIQY